MTLSDIAITGAQGDRPKRDDPLPTPTFEPVGGPVPVLFENLISSMCVDGALAGRLEDGGEHSVDARLRDLGWTLLQNLMSVNGIALYRAVVAEAQRRPELGRLFYENGAKLVRSLAADILSTVYDDHSAALRASTFISLVLGDAHLELTLGYTITNRDARFAEQIEEAVSAALR